MLDTQGPSFLGCKERGLDGLELTAAGCCQLPSMGKALEWHVMPVRMEYGCN